MTPMSPGDNLEKVKIQHSAYDTAPLYARIMCTHILIATRLFSHPSVLHTRRVYAFRPSQVRVAVT